MRADFSIHFVFTNRLICFRVQMFDDHRDRLEVLAVDRMMKNSHS